MEADWDEISHATFPVQSPGSSRAVSTLAGNPFQQRLQAQQQHAKPAPYATAVAFDTSVELLWVGGSNGRVSSFYGLALHRYTAWRAQPEEAGVIEQFLFNDKGVIILGTQTVLYVNRRGIQHWILHYESTNDATKFMQNLQCMSFTSKPTEILVAGAQERMFVIDITKGEIVKHLDTNYHYTIMKKSRFSVCAATTTGAVHFLDPTTFQITKMWQAHPAFINDMDVRADFVVTCGGTIKHLPNQSNPNKNLDFYLNAYDLAKNAAGPLQPVSLAVAAAHARLHPKMSSTTVVVAPHGQIHVVDLLNPNAKPTVTKMAPVASNIKLFEVAPSGQAFVLTDGECNSRLWGSPSKLPLRFTDAGADPIMPQPVQPAPEMSWSDNTPLSTIGMPYYREMLFSAWPADLISDVGAPPVQFPPAFRATLKPGDLGMFGPNTRGLLRNQQENTRASLQDPDSLQAPKFLSQKARESASTATAAADPVEELLADAVNLSLKPEAPQVYRKHEIKYSKYGVEDFDFGYYNKTQYAGLENQIPNSYANPLLQLMNYTPLLRNLALQHAASSCLDDSCILCELGFVFDMLQKAGGAACHATNMLSALASNVRAQKEHLIEDETKRLPLTDMAQKLCSFFLDQTALDYKKVAPASTSLEQALFAPRPPPGLPSPTHAELVDQVLNLVLERSNKCLSCGKDTNKPERSPVIELLYPDQTTRPVTVVRGGKVPKITFSQVLKMSVELETVAKGFCPICRRYPNNQVRRTVKSAVPAVLAINAAIRTSVARNLWATPGWLPQEIGIIIDRKQFYCYEGQDLQLHLQRGIHKITVYSLVGMVVNIEGPLPQNQHLAALINVAHSADPEVAPASNWHLFNDFHVRPVSAADALTFNTTWKSPSVLMFQLKAANNRSNPEWKTKLDTSVLLWQPGPPGSGGGKTYEPLDQWSEMPVPEGSTVALDAEFVSLRDEEIHLNEDGQKETVRPRQLALARVSVVRGEGEKQGVPFIDDYISIKQPIQDYLTAFSGIYNGDLDPSTSRHQLVSLKIAYKKLWVLLNLGCVFVGHGLKQDLRVINIRIPPDQVIDTIEKFKIGVRKLSLKFLTWCILKENIQTQTHDSIEDAQAALMLYKKYQEFHEAGVLREMLQQISNMGKKHNYKPPLQTQAPTLPAEVAMETGAAAAAGGSTEGSSNAYYEEFNPRRGAGDIFSDPSSK